MAKFVEATCRNCGKTRLIQRAFILKPYYTGLCQNCARRSRIGEGNPNWQEGKYRTTAGYVCVRIYPDNFFWLMAQHDGYAREHRLVMAMHLGRCLQRWEHVNHKNGIKDDNRIENLELRTPSDHIRNHSKGYRDGYGQGFNDGRSAQVKQLRAEIAELKLKFKEVEG